MELLKHLSGVVFHITIMHWTYILTESLFVIEREWSSSWRGVTTTKETAAVTLSFLLINYSNHHWCETFCFYFSMLVLLHSTVDLQKMCNLLWYDCIEIYLSFNEYLHMQQSQISISGMNTFILVIKATICVVNSC